MTTEAHRILRKLGEEWGISENQATERAIREAFERLVEEEDESGNENAPVEEELRGNVSYLKEQLRVRDEEIRRRDHLMAAALERIPALEEKSGAQRDDLRASEDSARGTGREEAERRPWWRLWGD